MTRRTQGVLPRPAVLAQPHPHPGIRPCPLCTSVSHLAMGVRRLLPRGCGHSNMKGRAGAAAAAGSLPWGTRTACWQHRESGFESTSVSGRWGMSLVSGQHRWAGKAGSSGVKARPLPRPPDAVTAPSRLLPTTHRHHPGTNPQAGRVWANPLGSELCARLQGLNSRQLV